MATTSSKHRIPQLSIPVLKDKNDTVEPWFDKFDLADDAEDENGIKYTLNLGAESPCFSFTSSPSTVFEPEPEITKSYDTHTPLSPSISRRLSRGLPSNDMLLKSGRENVAVAMGSANDCHLCAEYAIHPLQTVCCQTVFCRDHILDWLNKSSSPDGACPSCGEPCSLRLVSQPLPRPRTETVRQISSLSTTTSQSPTSYSMPLNHNLDQNLEGIQENDEEDSTHWLIALTHSILRFFQSLMSPNTEGKGILESIGRLISVLGLTLLFYVLFASHSHS